MGQETKYHITKDGDIYRINDDGTFTDLGNAEKRVKKEPAQVAPPPKKNNFLIPLMQRHWACHCAKAKENVFTIFQSGGIGCQLLSNKTDQLLLNFTLEAREDKERLYRFKKHRYYELFDRDGDVYALELGGVTEWSIQVTTAILTEIFGISVCQKIPVDFYTDTWGPDVSSNIEKHEEKPQSQLSKTEWFLVIMLGLIAVRFVMKFLL